MNPNKHTPMGWNPVTRKMEAIGTVSVSVGVNYGRVGFSADRDASMAWLCCCPGACAYCGTDKATGKDTK